MKGKNGRYSERRKQCEVLRRAGKGRCISKGIGQQKLRLTEKTENYSLALVVTEGVNFIQAMWVEWANGKRKK